MKIYNFDAESRAFISEGRADESPLEPGVYLLPANATFEEPPKTQTGQGAFWDGVKWVVMEVPPIVELEDGKPSWDDIRFMRDCRLSASDWTQLPDVSLSSEKVAEWREYRKQLRSIVSSFETPESVVWPSTP